jgi:Transcriptional regulators
MATIKDIARMSGYSIGTVSRVINKRTDVSDQAREKIEEIIRENDYQPNTNAKRLKQTVSSEVSVIVHGNRSTFLAFLLEEIQIRMREHGESINVQFTGEKEDEVAAAIQIAQNLKPKGFIFLGGNSRDFRDEFSQITLPSVVITIDAENMAFDNLSSFTTDDEAAADCAVSKLVAEGHRRIGIIGGLPGDYSGERRNDHSTLRIRGAVSELEKNGITFDFDRDYEACDFSAESGYQAAKRLMEKSPDLTAIFAVTDAQAVGVLRELKDRGLSVPEDISVVGFNGVDYVRYSIPRLATIRQDAAMLARKSVDDLLLRISFGSPAVYEKIPYEYVDGESAAPPRK